MATSPTVRTPSDRVVQGILLVVGAAALAILVGDGRIRFFWTPLIIGATYLAAALAGGRTGGYWATACGLTGWGLAVAFVGHIRPHDIDTSGAYLTGAGLGVTLGLLLARRGVAVSDVGLALTVASGGLILALTPRAPDTLDDANTYAIAIGVIGAANVIAGAVQLARGRAAPA